MTRPSGKSRVAPQSGGAQSSDPSRPSGPKPIPSLRQRRPFMYWMVVLATLAMVLATFASLISVIA